MDIIFRCAIMNVILFIIAFVLCLVGLPFLYYARFYYLVDISNDSIKVKKSFKKSISISVSDVKSVMPLGYTWLIDCIHCNARIETMDQQFLVYGRSKTLIMLYNWYFAASANNECEIDETFSHPVSWKKEKAASLLINKTIVFCSLALICYLFYVQYDSVVTEGCNTKAQLMLPVFVLFVIAIFPFLSWLEKRKRSIVSNLKVSDSSITWYDHVSKKQLTYDLPTLGSMLYPCRGQLDFHGCFWLTDLEKVENWPKLLIQLKTAIDGQEKAHQMISKASEKEIEDVSITIRKEAVVAFIVYLSSLLIAIVIQFSYLFYCKSQRDIIRIQESGSLYYSVFNNYTLLFLLICASIVAVVVGYRLAKKIDKLFNSQWIGMTIYCLMYISVRNISDDLLQKKDFSINKGIMKCVHDGNVVLRVDVNSIDSIEKHGDNYLIYLNENDKPKIMKRSYIRPLQGSQQLIEYFDMWSEDIDNLKNSEFMPDNE